MTDRIFKIISGLELSEARIVIRELTEMFDERRGISGSPLANTRKTPDEILELLKEKCARIDLSLTSASDEIDLSYCGEIDRIPNGLSRVNFDFENYEFVNDPRHKPCGHLLGPRYFGKIPGIGCYAGGDWEHPVFFIIYLDADGQDLRSYVPKNGNMWNYSTGSAFGNDDEVDSLFITEWAKKNRPDLSAEDMTAIQHSPVDNARLMFDELLLMKDIEDNIRVE